MVASVLVQLSKHVFRITARHDTHTHTETHAHTKAKTLRCIVPYLLVVLMSISAEFAPHMSVITSLYIV